MVIDHEEGPAAIHCTPIKGCMAKGEDNPPMGELPSIQLLEATHHFPGPYTFKVIGRVDNGFVARVVAAVRDELAFEIDPPFRCRETVGGRHVSITLEPRIQSVHQVLAVYRRMRGISGLVMLM